MSKLQTGKKMVSSVLAAGVFALAAAVAITGEASATDLTTVQAEADSLEEQLVALLEDAQDLPYVAPGDAQPVAGDPQLAAGDAQPAAGDEALPADVGKASPAVDGGAEPGVDEGAEPGVDEGAEPGVDEGAEPGVDGIVPPAADENVPPAVDGSGVDGDVAPGVDVSVPPAANDVPPGAVVGNVQPGPEAVNEPVAENGAGQVTPSGEVEQVGDVQPRTEIEVPPAKAGQEMEQELAYTGSDGMVPTGLAGLGMLALGVVMMRRGRPVVSRS